MAETIDRVKKGAGQAALGALTGDFPKFVEGALTVAGLETNDAKVQQFRAAEFEDFAFSALRLEDVVSQHTSRLDTLEQRQFHMQWAIEEFETRLGQLGARPSDLVALLEAGYEVWKKSADAKKRKLLANALRNAFDPKQYEEGLSLRLFSILRDLDYGDVHVLKTMQKQKVKVSSHPKGILNLRSEQLAKDHEEGRIPLRASNLVPDSMTAYHVQRLIDHGLCCKRKMIYQLDGKPSPNDGIFELIMPTVLGGRFLALVADRETAGDPQAAEPDPVPSP